MMTNDTRNAIERKIVRHAIRTLKAAGFEPVETDDEGPENVKTVTETAMLETVFSVDISRAYFQGADGRKHGILFVGGNGRDIISDYHCGNPEFSAAVDRACDYADSVEA